MSEATPEATPAQEQPPAAETAPTPAESTPVETDWKVEARKWEQRAKDNLEAARRLKEIEDRDLSELQKAQRDRDEAAARLAEFQRTTIRQQVALEKGVPASLVARLQGETAEEVAADADVLLAHLTRTATPAPDPSQGAQPLTPEAQAEAEYQKFFPSAK